MISFKNFGKKVRLGNQMFQYAYLRSQARRLSTQFYCPKWMGDDIFQLQDDSERMPHSEGVQKQYLQEPSNCGFSQDALAVGDHVEIDGYFQSEKYFVSTESVREWFSFRPSALERIKHLDQDLAIQPHDLAIHIRAGDFLTLPSFYVCDRKYFENSIAYLSGNTSLNNVYVFTDNQKFAKKLLGNLAVSLIWVEGNKDFEDLYLLSRFRNIICSASTFSWWAAYLGAENKSIIVPAEGSHRPGSQINAVDFWPNTWVRIPGINSWEKSANVIYLRQLNYSRIKFQERLNFHLKKITG